MVTVCGETLSGGTERRLDRVERSGRGGPSGAIDGDDLAAAGGRVEAEAIAADPRRLRLDDREHGASRDRSVNGVAARAQHFDRGQRGDRHGGRRHPVHGIDGAASVLMEVPQWRVLSGRRDNVRV
jgi:hypothetical protein